MEELTLAVPGMWADHHVLVVRGLLRGEGAVTSTYASALTRLVRVEYDDARTDPQAITALLTGAGYACGEPEAAADPPPTSLPGRRPVCASPRPTPSTSPCPEITASTECLLLLPRCTLRQHPRPRDTRARGRISRLVPSRPCSGPRR